MLDDLDEHGGVQAGEPVVAVGECRLQDLQPGALPLRHRVEMQPARSDLQRSGRYVGRHDALDGSLGEQVLEQRTVTAAEVTDAARSAGADGGEDRATALLRERDGTA